MKKSLSSKVFSLVITFIMAMLMTVGSFPVFAEETTGSETTQTVAEPEPLPSDEVLEDFIEPEYHSEFTMPDELRAVAITPTIDFASDANMPLEQLQDELNKMMDDIIGKGMNAVIINTDNGTDSFYSTDVNEMVNKSAIELAIQAAKDKGLFVYLTFDMNYILGQKADTELSERIDYLALQAHIFTVKYPVDGVILSGYYSSKSTVSFDDYMQNGSGIGFDNWLLDNGAYVFSLVSDAIRRTNNTVPVGISIKDVWANSTTIESGSKTEDTFQALTDGFSDTLSYVKKGYADFVMLEAEGALSDPKLPFEELVTWWAKATTEVNIPLYVMHENDKLCTDAAGWISPDQIVHQLIAAKKVPGYKGSAYKSYKALKENSGSSTTALVSYYNDKLNMDTIGNELTMVSPTKLQFTTEEPSVKFQGTFDSNFEVYFNGEIIELNEAGNFYYEEDLDVGLNVFTIKNKAKTYTYRITRKVTVLKAVEPKIGEMTVEEKTNIVINAIAYKGSKVSATLNGKNIPMEAIEGTVEGYENSNYIKFSGVYVAPKGIINKSQNLGNISVYGTYTGKNGAKFEGSIQGANIIVNALPEVPNNADGNLIKTLNDNTMVYDYRSTNTVPTPNQARLPAGVLDYVIKKVKYDDEQYYLTLSGKRILCSDVQVLENAPIGVNNIEAISASMDGNDTIVKIKQSARTPFSLSYSGVSYGNPNGYTVTGFSSDSMTFIFDYSNSSSGDLSFPSESIFSSATWGETMVNDVNKQTLTFRFKNPGIFSGVSSTYDSDGNLTFRFNGYRRSLNGATIVIDPGHGVKPTGFDHGGVGHITDQAIGLAISKLLEQKFTAEGARVIRYHTESQYYDTYKRSDMARQYKPDLYISVHGNAVQGNNTARGVEAFYFVPFSQPFAAKVSAEVAAYYQNSVYKDGVNRNRGAKYDYFAVTTQQEFPSILLEVGFVTTKAEAMAMNNPTHQNGIADAVVRGTKKYLSR